MELFRTEVRVTAPAISLGCFAVGMAIVIFTRAHWLHVLGAFVAALEFSYRCRGQITGSQIVDEIRREDES